MHLPKLPTIFVKNGEERQAFFTVQARELLAAGWVEKTEEEIREEILSKKVEPPLQEKNPAARKARTSKKSTTEVIPEAIKRAKAAIDKEPAVKEDE